MENTELQSTFELIDNIEFEEKVDFENLVLYSEPTDIPNLETSEIKEEPFRQIKILCQVMEATNLENF